MDLLFPDNCGGEAADKLSFAAPTVGADRLFAPSGGTAKVAERGPRASRNDGPRTLLAISS